MYSFEELTREECLLKSAEEAAELVHALLKKVRYPHKYEHDGRIMNLHIKKEWQQTIHYMKMVDKHLSLDLFEKDQ
jgi:hypothetical protein